MKTINTVCLGKINRFDFTKSEAKDGVNAPLITRRSKGTLYDYYGWVINKPNYEINREIRKVIFNIKSGEAAAIQKIDWDNNVVEYYILPIYTIDCPGEWFHISRDVDDEMYTIMRNHYSLIKGYEFRGHSYLDHEAVYVFDFNYLNPVKNPYQTAEGVQAYGRTVLAPYLDDDDD